MTNFNKNLDLNADSKDKNVHRPVVQKDVNLNLPVPVKQRRVVANSDLYLNVGRYLKKSKYPIFLPTLLDRIDVLKKELNSETEVQVFFPKDDITIMKKILFGKGGIYILWCQSNGYFYVGSAISFFGGIPGSKARLTSYFSHRMVQWSLDNNSTRITKALGKAIIQYGINDFVVIILEENDTIKIRENREELFFTEQAWMMLYPTFNASLTVYLGNAIPKMEEDVREEMSNIIYVYQFKDGKIVGYVIVHGIKEISRTGVKDMITGETYNIHYNQVRGYFGSLKLWQGKFVFYDTILPEDTVLWPDPKDTKVGKIQKVWVFNYESEKLIDVMDRTKGTKVKYDISATHLMFIRECNLPFNGLFFYNTPNVDWPTVKAVNKKKKFLDQVTY